MSKNDTARASLMASKVSAPRLATFHPRFSRSLDTHPAIPSAQGTENTRPGTRSLFPDTVIIRKSGNPSKLASPSLMGTGKDGFREVSSTSSEGDRGKREDRGKRRNAWAKEENKHFINLHNPELKKAYRVIRTIRKVKSEIWIGGTQILRWPTNANSFLDTRVRRRCT